MKTLRRNDLETFKELLQANDARATALFFLQSEDNIRAASVLAANSLNPRKVTLKRSRKL